MHNLSGMQKRPTMPKPIDRKHMYLTVHPLQNKTKTRLPMRSLGIIIFGTSQSAHPGADSSRFSLDITRHDPSRLEDLLN